MSTTAQTGWTIDALQEHWETVSRLHREIYDERDRRYAEVNIERQKALSIKERADERALDLARVIQDYKDEKANELREQINSERGMYVTIKDFEPVKAFMTAELSRSSVTDPALASMIAELSSSVKELKGTNAGGRKEIIAWFIAGIASLASIASIGGAIIAYMKYAG